MTNVNEAPYNLTLSNNHIAENLTAGVTVGVLAALDPDVGDTVTFSIVSSGVPFGISGTQLVTTAMLDYEAHPSYSVTVRGNRQRRSVRATDVHHLGR